MFRVSFVFLFIGFSGVSLAQVVDPVPDELQRETYVAPGEIVSFGPDTPFDQFVRSINPLFQRRYGKTLVDPTGRLEPIGFFVTGLSFLDALDLVLSRSSLALRETDRYYLIEPVEAIPTTETRLAAASDATTARATDREVRVDAIIFQVNLTRVREIGTDWSPVFGSQQQGSGDSGGQDAERRLRLFLRTKSFFESISEVVTGPDVIDIAELNRIFRLFETNGVGRTISTPSVVVRSGQEGRVQSGADIPVTVRDFAGNTITQFISTGVIIDALPRVIVDRDSIGNQVEFVHLVVDVEQSAGQLATFGIQINKNQGTTDLLLANGEQAVIGGLYTTEQTLSHKGIPLLKDIPLLGHLFGVRTRSVTERELIIVLQASIVDPIVERVDRARARDLIERERLLREARLNQSQGGLGDGTGQDN